MVIYKVTHTKTGKAYIGQTIRDFKNRKAEHLRAAANVADVKNPAPLHADISRYGSGEFSWEILEECSSCDHMNERERFYIKLLNTLAPDGYNQTIGGYIDGSMSVAVREKIAKAVVELHKDPEYQAKVYPKLKGLVPPNKGIPISDAQKAKIGAARKAVYADPTYVNPNIGQKRTAEQKERIREGQKGNMATGDAWQAAHKDQYTPEVRAKMREKKLGKKPANTKLIECIETGQVFNGLTDASQALGINRQSIYLQIKGTIKAAGGKHFRYKEAA